MAAQTQPETPAAVAEPLPRAALCTYAEEVAKEDGCSLDDDGGGAVEPPSLARVADAVRDLRAGCEKGVSRGAAESADGCLVAACVNESRGACLLPFLNGAAPVCYGVPTRWRSRFAEGSRDL